LCACINQDRHRAVEGDRYVPAIQDRSSRIGARGCSPRLVRRGTRDRYPPVAGSISFDANTADGHPREWTKLALRLLENAPGRVAVLRRCIAEVRGQGGFGSPVRR
jgi:hypothetical protein